MPTCLIMTTGMFLLFQYRYASSQMLHLRLDCSQNGTVYTIESHVSASPYSVFPASKRCQQLEKSVHYAQPIRSHSVLALLQIETCCFRPHLFPLSIFILPSSPCCHSMLFSSMLSFDHFRAPGHMCHAPSGRIPSSWVPAASCRHVSHALLSSCTFEILLIRLEGSWECICTRRIHDIVDSAHVCTLQPNWSSTSACRAVLQFTELAEQAAEKEYRSLCRRLASGRPLTAKANFNSLHVVQSVHAITSLLLH